MVLKLPGGGGYETLSNVTPSWSVSTPRTVSSPRHTSEAYSVVLAGDGGGFSVDEKQRNDCGPSGTLRRRTLVDGDGHGRQDTLKIGVSLKGSPPLAILVKDETSVGGGFFSCLCYRCLPLIQVQSF